MTNKKLQTFGELMREYLKNSSWTGAEVARRTGFSKTYIGNLLQDRAPSTKSGKPKRLPAETVDKIARALKIPLNDARLAAGLAPIEEKASPETREKSSSSTPMTTDELVLLYFHGLPQKLQLHFLKMLGDAYHEEIDRRDLEKIGLKPGEKLYDMPAVSKN